MKVLLMVEREGRVVCSGRAWRECFSASGYERHSLGGTKMYGACYMTTAMATADRWWLVEAESAEAAREVIAKFGEYFPVGSSITVPRILASGGRS